MESWSEHWRELLPVAGAQENVSRLHADGHTLFVVTKRSGLGVQAAKMLLHRWEIGDFDDIVGVGQENSKRETARSLRLDAMVDNSLANLEAMDGIVQHRLLFGQPANRGVVLREGITPVVDWPAVYHHISNIAIRAA